MYLRDTLLWCAEAGVYRVHWSQEILDEATDNLVGKNQMKVCKAARLQSEIKAAFPEAMVEVPLGLVEVMTNHPKDRDVLAAAVVARAQVIVTANIKDFPASAFDLASKK